MRAGVNREENEQSTQVEAERRVLKTSVNCGHSESESSSFLLFSPHPLRARKSAKKKRRRRKE